jgi:hypothetical protein
VARQGTHEVNDIVVGAPVRTAKAILLHRQTRVIAALPVNDQLERVADDIDDDLRNDDADDLLARLRRGSRAIPRYGQVSLYPTAFITAFAARILKKKWFGRPAASLIPRRLSFQS